jgi:hypothetical protein
MPIPNYNRIRSARLTWRKAYPDILGGQLVPVSTILAKVVGIRENWHKFLAVWEMAYQINVKIHPSFWRDPAARSGKWEAKRPLNSSTLPASAGILGATSR